MIALVQQGINWASWGAIMVALVLGVINLGITLRSNTKRVKIRSSVEFDTVGKTSVPFYRCRITNTGAIGLQIEGVQLYPPSG